MQTESFQIREASWAQDRRDIKLVREQVFVIEQNIPADLEWDEADTGSLHLLAYRQNRDAVGTCRLESSGKIGRLAVLEECREQGLGTLLLTTLIEIAKASGQTNLFLHAQTQAISFYERHGFSCEGEHFLEGGIHHINMQLHVERRSDMEQVREKGERWVISTREEYQQAVVAVAGVAERKISIYTHDLEPGIYDDPEFLEVIKHLVLSKRYARVRVLINDPAHAIKNGNALVHLGRRLNSYIEFRNVRKDLRTSTESFCIADGAALVYRKDKSRWEGIADTWDPSVTKTYTARFDEIWNASEVEFEFRQLGM